MTTTVVSTVLNRKNYDDWSSRIKTYMLAKDLWDVLDQEHPKTEDEESNAWKKKDAKAWKKKDAKALYAIQNSCGDDTYKLIKNKTKAKEAWDTLSEKLKKRNENPSDEHDKSVLQAYPTSTPTEDTRSEILMEEGRTGGNDTRPEVSMEEGRTGGRDENRAGPGTKLAGQSSRISENQEHQNDSG